MTFKAVINISVYCSELIMLRDKYLRYRNLFNVIYLIFIIIKLRGIYITAYLYKTNVN